MKETSYNDKLTLYFLAWQDCVDRLDTLLLETRHIQQNLIYSLRSPLLYRPLRYEESFLWGKDAFCAERLVKSAEEGCDSKTIADKIADQSIILYPLPKHESERAVKNKFGLREEIERQLESYIEDVLIKSKWSMDQRRYYHNLYAIQKIKRNIFSDKIMICQEGFYAFGIFPKRSVNEKETLPRFMLLRSAILFRISDYIARLGDHQEDFSKSLDMGLQDHPRPSMERRREQRIYTTYLSQRSLDLWLEIKMLVKKLDEKLDKQLRRSSILNRWQHNFTSNANSFFDDVANTIDHEEREGGEAKKLSPYSHYINTSYFMPDSPNLQSLIAHEVSHSFLKDYLDDLSRQKLNLKTESFYRLVKQIGQCMDVYHTAELLGHSTDSLTKEIAVDLLASAVKGPAYLYALFLEITGNGLENLFITGKYNEIELKLFDYLNGAAGQYDQSRAWYIRLSVVCTWLERIFEKYEGDSPRTQLAVRLIKSIKTVLDDMVNYLDEIARPPQQWKSYWKSLNRRISILISHSDATDLVREWWEEKKKDYNGEKKFPVYTYPLHNQIREYLLNCFASKKFELAKGIDCNDPNLKEDINKYFLSTWNEIYKIEPTLSDYTFLDSEKNNLFEHIYDIPWQSSFLEGLDAVTKIEFQDKRIDWIDRLHEFSITTRKLYQIALDFHIGHVDYFPYLRLREVVRLLTDKSINDNKNENKLKKIFNKNGDYKKIINEILKWIDGKTRDENNFNSFNFEVIENIGIRDIDDFKKKLNEIYKKRDINKEIENWYYKTECHAFFLLKATYTLLESGEKQILSRVILYKLNELYNIFIKHDHKELFKDDNFKILEPLFTYLDITHSKTQSLYYPEVQLFKLTEQDLENLRNNSNFICNKLKELDNELYHKKEKFVKAFEEKIGKETTVLYIPLIMEYAKISNNYFLTSYNFIEYLNNNLNDILKIMQNLKNDAYKKEEDFLKDLENKIGQDKANLYNPLILKYVLKNPLNPFFDPIMKAMSISDEVSIPMKQYVIGRVSIGSRYRLNEKNKPSIKLTSRSLKRMRKKGEDIIKIANKLEKEKIKDKDFQDQSEFEKSLKEVIGEDYTYYKQIILEKSLIKLTNDSLENIRKKGNQLIDIADKLEKGYKNKNEYKYKKDDDYGEVETQFRSNLGSDYTDDEKDIILKHARITFKLTEQSLSELKNKVDNNIYEKIKGLKDIEYKSEADFIEALGTVDENIKKGILEEAKKPKHRFPEHFGDQNNEEYSTDEFQMRRLAGRYDYIIFGPTRKQGHHWLPLFQPTKIAPYDAKYPSCSLKENIQNTSGKIPMQCQECLSERGFKKSYPKLGEELPYQDEENFVPFFIRWEYASPIRLRKESWDDTNKKRPIALISVVLKHSVSRLHFLHRLLRVSREDQRGKDKPINLEQLKGYFQDGDCAFLSDGWEDLLIMLAGDPERVEDVFEIQKVLFEDFQVERTELILMPKALDYVFLKKENANKVRIEVLYRLMGDWKLTKGFDLFVEKFEENIQFNEKDTETFEKEFKNFVKELDGLPFQRVLSRIPGRMDFLLWLHPLDKVQKDKIQKIVDEYKELIQDSSGNKTIFFNQSILFKMLLHLIKETKVDRTQTTMGWKEDIEKS